MIKRLPQGQLLLVMLCATFAINVGSAGLTTKAISGKHFVVSGISVRKLQLFLFKKC